METDVIAEFRNDLSALINSHSLENESNTPDFILAGFLSKCLAAFDEAVEQRTSWYGDDPPTPGTENEPLRHELAAATDLLEKVRSRIKDIRTDSWDVNNLIEKVSNEIAEHLGIDPEGEE